MSLDDLLMMGTFCQIVEDLQRVHRTLDEHGRILRRLENYGKITMALYYIALSFLDRQILKQFSFVLPKINSELHL